VSQQEPGGEHVVAGVSAAVEAIESGRHVWLWAAAGLLLACAAWLVALFAPEWVSGTPSRASSDVITSKLLGLARLVFYGSGFAGPFLFTYAAVYRPQPDHELTDDVLLNNLAARERAERARRVLFSAILAGVANLMLLFIVSN
jgi:hypothetical protein